MAQSTPTTGPLRTKRLSTIKRLLLGGFAFVGTALYAASFALIRENIHLLPIAAAVGAAAGVSWIVFGITLLIVTKRRPSTMHWADACLVTMATGNLILLVSALANTIIFAFVSKEEPVAGTLIPLHAAVLIAADVIMGSIFIRRAVDLGLGRWAAALMWVFALNGFFALILLLLYKAGVLLQ